MKNVIVYIFIALILLSTQFYLSNQILVLILWILTGAIAVLAGVSKRLFLVGLVLQILIGYALFFKLSANNASYAVRIVENIGYSAGTLKIIVVVFNALTAGFALLLGSQITLLIRQIKERRKTA